MYVCVFLVCLLCRKGKVAREHIVQNYSQQRVSEIVVKRLNEIEQIVKSKAAQPKSNAGSID